MQKKYQQFRLKKHGSARVKFFKAIIAVNQGSRARCLAVFLRCCFVLFDKLFSVRRSLTETRQKKGTTRGRALAPPLKVPLF